MEALGSNNAKKTGLPKIRFCRGARFANDKIFNCFNVCPINIYICFCSHLKPIICLYSLWTCLSAYMRVGRKRVCFVGPPYNPYQSEDSLRRLFRLNAIQYKAVPCNTCNTIEHHGTPYHTVPELVDSSAWMAPVLKYQIPEGTDSSTMKERDLTKYQIKIRRKKKNTLILQWCWKVIQYPTGSKMINLIIKYQ